MGARVSSHIPKALFHRNIIFTRSMPYYAVKIGKTPGVYDTWAQCQAQVVSYPAARYKKFANKEDAMAFVQGSDAKQSSDLYDKASSLKHKLESVKELATQVRDTADELKKKDKSETNKTLAKDSGELLKAVKTCLGLADNVLSLTKDGGKKSASKRSHDESDSSSPSKKKSSGDKPVVYTDGCCFMNGRHGAVGGLGVYWGPGDSRNLSEKLSGHPTNNRAEIHAARRAVEQAKEAGISDLEIRTDSMFLINSMTQWINGWKKRGWKTSAGEPVKNTEDFQALEASMAGINVEWVHVEGHSGNEGNDAADKLSKEGAKKKE